MTAYSPPAPNKEPHSILPKQVPTHEEFRAFGMTSHAAQFPRSEVQIKMFAAWLGYPLETLPDPCKYFANATMKASWENAERVIREDERQYGE